jgi:cation diffusion facilitator family transporter
MATRKWSEEDFVVEDQRDLSRIRQVLVLTMVLNFAATAIKLAVGLLTGALSVVADALDSLFDGLSNVVGLAGLYAASKPADTQHPYGHRKFETIAALSIAFLLFLTAWQLLQAAWSRLGSDVQPQVNAGLVVAMLASMLIQASVSYYELRQGRRLQSEILVADALHTRASILVSISVLAGLGLVRLGFPQADPILAAFVALVIAKIGVDILRETLPVLVDQAAIDPGEIAGVVETVEGIESFHRVRSRGALGDAAVDLHIRVSPDKTIQEANAIADEVRRRLLALDTVNDVTVHIEAQRQPEREAADMFATAKHASAELGLTVHEVWAHRAEGNLYLEMHIGVEPHLTLGEAHRLVDRLEGEVRARLPEVKAVHTHIELATARVQEDGLEKPELEEHIRLQVEHVVSQIPSLQHPHNIRIRRNPEAGDKLYISLECTVAPDTPVTQAHYLASLLEQEIGRRIEDVADVSVHLEPPGEG